MNDDESAESQEVNIDYSKWTDKDSVPTYFSEFMVNKGTNLSTALREGGREKLSGLLSDLSTNLPKGSSFKEIAALIFRQKNGDLYLSLVQGSIDQINEDEAAALLDDLVQSAPLDSEHVILIHTHPESPDPFESWQVGLSPEDQKFVEIMGSKLKIMPNLNGAYVGLSTSRTTTAILKEGRNEGLAWGWSFDLEKK